MTTFLGRIQNLAKLSSDWNSSNPVLMSGEFGVSDPGSSAPILKCGDGTRPWSALPALNAPVTQGPGYVAGNTVTLAPGSSATVVIDNTVSPPTISFGIPRGLPGPPNTLTVGTVTTGAPGSAAVVTITGVAPNQTLNMTIPRGNTGATGATGATGVAGPPNTLAIGTVTTGAAGSAAAATITGTSPNQTLNLTIPRGNTGVAGPANTLAIGTVTTGAAGSAAAATITGTSPNQTLNMTIPSGLTGPANTLAIGTVTTGTPGGPAAATITGTAPNQTLNLTIPTGAQGPQGIQGPPGNAGTVLADDSNVTGDWVFDPTQWFGFTAADVAAIKANPAAVWTGDGDDALHAEGRLRIDRLNATPNLYLQRINGTYGATTKILGGDAIGSIGWLGSRDANAAMVASAAITGVAVADWSATSAPTAIDLSAVTAGSLSRSTCVRIAAAANEHYVPSYLGFTTAEIAAIIANAAGINAAGDWMHVNRSLKLDRLAGSPIFTLQRTDGAFNATTGIASGEILGGLRYAGSLASNGAMTLGASLEVNARAAWGPGSTPSQVELWLVPSSTSALQRTAYFNSVTGGGASAVFEGNAGAQSQLRLLGGSSTYFMMQNKDAATDAKNWLWLMSSGTLALYCYDDPTTTGNVAMSISRTANVPQNFTVNATPLFNSKSASAMVLKAPAGTPHSFIEFWPDSTLGTRSGYVGYSPASALNVVTEVPSTSILIKGSGTGSSIKIQADADATSAVYFNSGAGFRFNAGQPFYLFTPDGSKSATIQRAANQLSVFANAVNGYLALNAGDANSIIDCQNMIYIRTAYGIVFDGAAAGQIQLTPQSTGALRLTTPFGFIDFGPRNSSLAHFGTDRAAYYFEKPVWFAGQPIFYQKGAIPYYADAAMVSGVVTVQSTVPSSGGAVGDQWLVV